MREVPPIKPFPSAPKVHITVKKEAVRCSASTREKKQRCSAAHPSILTVRNGVTDRIIDNGRHDGIHQVLDHNVLRILGAHRPGFQETESGLEEEADDSAHQHKKHIDRIEQVRIKGLQFFDPESGRHEIRGFVGAVHGDEQERRD